jgi:hypothetical protein
MPSKTGTTPEEQGGGRVQISYHPQDDYLYVRLRSEAKGTLEGEDIAPGMILLTHEEGMAVELEVSSASKLVDLGELQIEGLPVSVTAPKRVAG